MRYLCTLGIQNMYYMWVTIKVKVRTLDIAPLRSESLLQKRSGMARVLKGFHNFTCTHTHIHLQSE